MVPTSAQWALLRNIAQILPLKEQVKSRIYKIEKTNRKRCSLSYHLICLRYIAELNWNIASCICYGHVDSGSLYSSWFVVNYKSLPFFARAISFESSTFLLQVGVPCASGSFSAISMVFPGNGNDDCSVALSFSILASSLARIPAGGTRLFRLCLRSCRIKLLHQLTRLLMFKKK